MVTTASLPMHAAGDLHHRLGDHGVHLAGHDRAAGLRLGERQLEDAAARAAAEPADVVGDLGERDGDRLQLAVGGDERILGGLGLEVVLGFVEVDAELLA